MGEKMLITQALTEKETLQDEICRLIQESKKRKSSPAAQKSTIFS